MIKKRNDLSSNHGFLMVMGVPFPWFSIPKRNDGKTLDIVIRIFRHSSSNPGPKTWSVERIQGGGLKNDARCTRCLSKIWMIYWLVVWNNHPNWLMMIYLEWYQVLQKTSSHPMKYKTIDVMAPPVPQFNVVLWIMCLAAFKKNSHFCSWCWALPSTTLKLGVAGCS